MPTAPSMKSDKEFENHFLKGHEKYLRHISIDCVMFGFHEAELKVLLIKMKYAGKWALPGGFVLKEEPMDEAAQRILKERTGLDQIYLQQFYVFGNPERSDNKMNRQFLNKAGLKTKKAGCLNVLFQWVTAPWLISPK